MRSSCAANREQPQLSRSVVSDSLRSRGPQHTRPPCPSPTPRACSNPCPLSRWCHPPLSSSVVPFHSRLQSFPASGPFQRVSSSHQVVKVLEFQLQQQFFQWTPRTYLLQDGLAGSPCSSRDSQRVLSNTTVQKYQFWGAQLSLESFIFYIL